MPSSPTEQMYKGWENSRKDYGTPQDFFDTLNNEFHFDVDVAADDILHKCDKYFTKEIDGLKQNWYEHGKTMFCNPPYGRSIADWVKKAKEEAEYGVTTVLLVPARTDTKWFHEHIWSEYLHRPKPGCEIRFVKGRLHYTLDGKDVGGSAFPSMVIVIRGID